MYAHTEMYSPPPHTHTHAENLCWGFEANLFTTKYALQFWLKVKHHKRISGVWKKTHSDASAATVDTTADFLSIYAILKSYYCNHCFALVRPFLIT